MLVNTLPTTGMHDFLFQILDATPAVIWQSGPVSLAVDNGLYSVVLGSASTNPIPPSVSATPNLTLRVTVDGQVLSPDSAIVPTLQAYHLLGTFSGDLGGIQAATVVDYLQGIPLDLTSTPPDPGQGIVFLGGKWVPGSVTGAAGPAGATGDPLATMRRSSPRP